MERGRGNKMRQLCRKDHFPPTSILYPSGHKPRQGGGRCIGIFRILFANSALLILLFLASCGGGGGDGEEDVLTNPVGTGDDIPTDSSGLTASFTSDKAAGTNNVTMEQISANGDEVTVAIKFNSISESFKGADVDLTYDSTVSTISSVNQGDLLTGSVSGGVLYTDDSGSLLISNIDSSVSSSQSGTFCTIVFKGTASGNGTVNILSVSSAIFNAAGDSISGVSWSGGTVVVQQDE